MTNELERTLERILQELNALRRDVAQLRALDVLILPTYTVAGLPAAGTNRQLVIATNGRKTGEGAGAGTGVLAMWNQGTAKWVRVSDDTQVVA